MKNCEKADFRIRPTIPSSQVVAITKGFVSKLAVHLEDAVHLADPDMPDMNDLAFALSAALCEVWRLGVKWQQNQKN